MARGQTPEFLRRQRRKFRLGEFAVRRPRGKRSGKPVRRRGKRPRRKASSRIGASFADQAQPYEWSHPTYPSV